MNEVTEVHSLVCYAVKPGEHSGRVDNGREGSTGAYYSYQ